MFEQIVTNKLVSYEHRKFEKRVAHIRKHTRRVSEIPPIIHRQQ